ncbi:hypothetical protein [uncultured Tateyamaria sp.]|uniref:hypothetical protein n=1 Tax=uncultured Tateyamaria sp. TaxID=455651 RepID=UPI0026249A68|nr:hypothetical protein [uncultured Tateyamaria sp.]
MDFESLVEPITDYLSFSISFWSGDMTVLEKFAGSENVEPDALLFMLVGIGLMLVIRYSRLNIIPTDTTQVSNVGPKLDSSTLLLFLSTSLLTPLILELSFWLSNTRNGNFVKAGATFNASFLSFALIAPISGVQTRINYVLIEVQKVGGRVAKSALWLNVAIGLATLYPMTFALRVFPEVLNTTWSEIARPILASGIIFIVFVAIIGFYLYHWNKYIFSEADK